MPDSPYVLSSIVSDFCSDTGRPAASNTATEAVIILGLGSSAYNMPHPGLRIHVNGIFFLIRLEVYYVPHDVLIFTKRTMGHAHWRVFFPQFFDIIFRAIIIFNLPYFPGVFFQI